MVTDHPAGRDLRFRKAHDPYPPLSLEGWCRIPVFVGITGKDHAVHMLTGGGIHDLLQRFQEVHHPEGQARVRILPAVVGHVDMRVCKITSCVDSEGQS